jgi:aryl-alcohol dehydrogenase-like predicted oxidoreductase
LIVQANAIARELGARPIAVSQPRYSLLYRHPETQLFPTTGPEGVGNVTFSPLAHGMLTGKYKPGEEAPPGTRAADAKQNSVIKEMYWKDDYKERAQKLADIAHEMGTTAARLAIAWCLANPNVSSVILGATSVKQLEENLAAGELELSSEVKASIEALFPEVPA